jgi:hypothetical protein
MTLHPLLSRNWRTPLFSTGFHTQVHICIVLQFKGEDLQVSNTDCQLQTPVKDQGILCPCVHSLRNHVETLSMKCSHVNYIGRILVEDPQKFSAKCLTAENRSFIMWYQDFWLSDLPTAVCCIYIDLKQNRIRKIQIANILTLSSK